MTTYNFSDLITQHPTSEELIRWASSEEGGRLRVRTAHDDFAIIHYDKDTSDMTKPHVGMFRSVIWNLRTNRPVCMAPVKSAAFDALTPATADVFIVEDFVDGVMVNMFHDGTMWLVATRTQLDARRSFYGTRSFCELFWETFANKGLTLEMFDTHLTYSWVLQHPDERIVVTPNYGIPQLWLVECYSALPSGNMMRVEVPPAFQALRPATHTDVKTLDAIRTRVEAWGRRMGFGWQGLVIRRQGDSARYKLRSREYNEARHLRGNQANRRFIWLERWSAGVLNQYLRIYPEETADANAVVDAYKAITNEVYAYYTKVYREKSMRLGEAPAKYRKFLWDAHQGGHGAYFPNLRKFMNAQDTARKLWVVNFDRRFAAAAPE